MRKLNEEVENLEKLEPSLTSGPEAQVQLIKYNSYYTLFLQKAPLLLQLFEAASDAVLSFLARVEGKMDELAYKRE